MVSGKTQTRQLLKSRVSPQNKRWGKERFRLRKVRWWSPWGCPGPPGNQAADSEASDGGSILRHPGCSRPDSCSLLCALEEAVGQEEEWAFCCQGQHVFRWTCVHTHFLGGRNGSRYLLSWGVCFPSSPSFCWIWFDGCCTHLLGGLSSLGFVSHEASCFLSVVLKQNLSPFRNCFVLEGRKI